MHSQRPVYTDVSWKNGFNRVNRSQSTRRAIYLYTYLSVCLSVCLSVNVFAQSLKTIPRRCLQQQGVRLNSDVDVCPLITE